MIRQRLPKITMPVDSRLILGVAIILAVLVGAWMFRYEQIGGGMTHRNRFTGATCLFVNECWFSNDR